MTGDEILKLARAYAEHTGKSLSSVGLVSCGNNAVFRRLSQGGGADIRTVARAAHYFTENWPADLPWPESVRAWPGDAIGLTKPEENYRGKPARRRSARGRTQSHPGPQRDQPG